MSSHHLQSNSDPNYLLCLQNLRIDESAAAANNNTNRRSNSLHASHGSSIGAIESIARGGDGYLPPPINNVQKQSPIDYKLYDRNNIIAASKYGSPKPVENIEQHRHQQQQQQTSAGMYNAGYFINSSPTHSLSGSSHHSDSPRTSMIVGGSGTGTPAALDSRIAPVYENIEYFSQPTSSDYHNLAYYGSFESSNKKAQPQVPSNGLQQIAIGGSAIGGGRFAHTPQPELETAPIYENLPAATGKKKSSFKTERITKLFFFDNRATCSTTSISCCKSNLLS